MSYHYRMQLRENDKIWFWLFDIIFCQFYHVWQLSFFNVKKITLIFIPLPSPGVVTDILPGLTVDNAILWRPSYWNT